MEEGLDPDPEKGNNREGGKKGKGISMNRVKLNSIFLSIRFLPISALPRGQQNDSTHSAALDRQESFYTSFLIFLIFLVLGGDICITDYLELYLYIYTSV